MLGMIALAATIAPVPGSAYLLPAPGRRLVTVEDVEERHGRPLRLILATRPGARVAAPARGWVAYAGLFRTYGRIVILDHGHGWTTLLSGLASVDARAGQLAERGAVLGRMGGGKPVLTVELRHHGRGIDAARMAAAATPRRNAVSPSAATGYTRAQP